MCVLCRAFGKEHEALWHASSVSYDDGLTRLTSDVMPTPARANSVEQVASGSQSVDGLLSGVKWSGTVTYSFTDSRFDYAGGYGYGEPLNGFGKVSNAQATTLHNTLAAVENLTSLNISFAGTNGADIRIAKSAEANPTAYAYYPDDGGKGEGGDVWFGTSYNYSAPKLGNYSYITHVHEIGHSLGLKHPHEGGVVAGKLPAKDDALEYSVMSYRSYVGQSLDGGGYTNEQFGYPQGYMRNDIAALQEMYGADFSFNNGNSVYTFSKATGEMFINGVGQGTPGSNRVFSTVWDGGGNDTLNFSSYSNAVQMDLRPGLYSVTSAAQKAYLGDGHYAKGNLYNAYLYEGDARSYIENAVGSSGNDRLIGNAVGNSLVGAAGNDTLIGGGAKDRLNGGSGNDLYVGGSGADIFIFRPGMGADRIRDFDVAGGDVIQLTKTMFANFAAVMADASNVNDNVLIKLDGRNTFTLESVQRADLAANDFFFV